VRITIRNLQKKIPINQKKIKKIILEVLSKETVVESGQINICFVTGEEIRRLNSRYSGRDSSTDVLAFDLSNAKDGYLSDIFISTDAAVYNSRNFKTTPLYESYLYVIHGILHILGYDDRTAKDRALMRKKEKEYLKWPY